MEAHLCGSCLYVQRGRRRSGRRGVVALVADRPSNTTSCTLARLSPPYQIDTAGQERFQTLTCSFFRNADALVGCFAVNNKESAESVTGHFGEALRYSPKALKYLSATKQDLSERWCTEDQSQVRRCCSACRWWCMNARRSFAVRIEPTDPCRNRVPAVVSDRSWPIRLEQGCSTQVPRRERASTSSSVPSHKTCYSCMFAPHTLSLSPSLSCMYLDSHAGSAQISARSSRGCCYAQ